jgi:cytochrome c oxidase assembly protein subunit 15
VIETAVRRLAGRLPHEVDVRVRRMALASLAGQIVLIVTGGAVRLTSSGLGCPTWPRCTAESLAATPEMGIHGIVEFGNRMLTFALAAVALGMLVMLWKVRRKRRDLFVLALGLLASVPTQALIGGVTVLTGLNPWVVGLHFLVSMALVVFAMLLVNRAGGRTGNYATLALPALPPTMRPVTVATAAAAGAAVVLGVVVTGAGPHAGDAQAPRNGLDWELVSHIHAVPAYLVAMGAVFALILIRVRRITGPIRTAVGVLLGLIILQAGIGIAQYHLGIPVQLVALHMLTAALLMAAAVNAADLARWSPRPV